MTRAISVLSYASSAASVARKLVSGIFASVVFLGLATSAFAQQSGGSIRGDVQGADANTAVEIVDTARGITKSKGVDSNGEFRFDNITEGDYEVRVLQGGQVVDSAEVTVGLASATNISMATTAEAIEEIITTGTRMAALDTSIAESGLVINSEELLVLPVQRDMSAVALLAPGTSTGDYQFGSNGNISFGGASIAENTSFINGLNTTNFRTGVGFSQVPFEFYETIQIKTGGYSAKYGRSLGGVMNAKSKSGSNDWDFGANVYFETDLETSPETYLAANDLDAEDQTTFDAYVSGPILKDRLFFYALYSDNDDDRRYASYGTGEDYDYNQSEGFWGVKLDAYITDNHHIEYTAFSDERTGIEQAYAYDDDGRGTYIGQTDYEEGGDNWIATYTGDFTDNLSLSVSYGENEANRTTLPGTAAIPYVNVYTAADGFNKLQNGAGAFFIDIGTDKREMTRVDLNWVLGNHDLSVGLDAEEAFADSFTVNTGGEYWVQDANAELFPGTPGPQGGIARFREYSNGGSFETSSNAYYIQDVWDVSDRWTLELGLRNENFENLNPEGGVFVEIEDQWAPRLAAVFDPKGDGQSKWFFNYGLYYLPIATNTNIRMSGGETYIHTWYDWDGVSVDGFGVPQNLGPVLDVDVFGNGEIPDTRSVTDNNIDAMYQSEIIVGYSRTLQSGNEIGIKGIYRNLETTIEDVAIDAAVIDYYNSTGTWDDTLVGGDTVEDVFGGFHQYVLTNPGNDMQVFIPEMEETIDLTAAQLNYPEAERQYGALEFTYSRPFDGKWGMDFSYTWAHSWGNHEGYVKSDNGQDDAGITTSFDQPGLTDNSNGDLPNDRRNTLKLYGTYQLDNGLRLGTNFLYQSGIPKSCLGLHPTDVFAQAYGNTASHFCEGEAAPRGSLGTTPDIMRVDLNAQYTLELGRSEVILSADLFNVFNAQNAVKFNEFGDTGNYDKVRQYQQPRALRLSARLRF